RRAAVAETGTILNSLNNCLDLGGHFTFRAQWHEPFVLEQETVQVQDKTVAILKVGAETLNLNFAPVDQFTAQTGAIATIFVKQGEDFIRVSTSLKKENGERAIGTALDRSHPAYALLLKGESFIGPAKLFGKDYMTSYVPIMDAQAKMIGILFVGIDISDNLRFLKEKVKSMKIGKTGGYFALNRKAGKTYGDVMIDANNEGKNYLTEKASDGSEFIKDMLEKNTGVSYYAAPSFGAAALQGKQRVAVFQPVPTMNWLIVGSAYTAEIVEDSVAQLIKYAFLALVLIVVVAFVLFYIVKRYVSVPLAEATRMANKMATGDLTEQVSNARHDEIGQLLNAINSIGTGLTKVIVEVSAGSFAIQQASQEIASGNADLSARTESQASSLEETSSSMEELTATVKNNADNARQASQLTTQASSVAASGGTVVNDVISTMQEIKDSSRRIADITGVIDGIAFQTNILALNAAVEAARAGEQGRGFAVVAAEVRSLAQRAAASATEIKLLINQSVEKVDQGSELVNVAGTTMREIVLNIEQVATIVMAISNASGEQSAGIDQISLAISDMDEMTQQNSALVEQAAAASESLRDQTERLHHVVGQFKVRR
ncbi:Cache 3/Cache 2 fusion domain-containing protein, partial [Undibacterium sp. CCC2.1]|uniref:methyl-accepting chemotaxis protein n=1 Tax=unclassified Undibacterium TaxID=2630295 RepID=UPI002B22BCD0